MTSATLPEAAKAVLSVALPFRRGGDAAGLPQRVKILSWGENIGRTTGARILVDDAVAASLSANQELVACDLVPMDYEHQSVRGHPNYQPDPRHSPGGGKIEVVAGEGVFLSAIAYSANGEQHADSYQDVSAVVHLDKASRPLWISSVALTQKGDVAGLEFSEAVAVLSARTALAAPTQSIMTPPTSDAATYRALIIKFLKLKDDATDGELIAAAEKKAGEPPEPDAMTPDSTAALSAVETRLAALETSHHARDRQDLVDRASREGKVIPLSAELIAQTPVAVLSAMIEGLPAGEVPLVTSGKKQAIPDKTVALSADESAAAKALGLSETEYRAGKNS